MSALAPAKPLEPKPKSGEPTWEMARYFPLQGDWTEAEYLRLCPERGVEFVDGHVEFLPMPTELHQFLLIFLVESLRTFVKKQDLGIALPAGLRVRLWDGRIREPDIVFLFKENYRLRENKHWRGADLAMEIVSADDPERDLVVKREEYAKCGIREYWIVDPRDSTITVLKLENGAYMVHCSGGKGQTVASALLPGFTADVAAAFTVP